MANSAHSDTPRHDITQLLDAANQGDPRAASELLPLVYEELRRLAAHKMAGEAWLRVAGANQQTWQGRGHFFAAAAETMRRILVDRARRCLAAKRGAGAERVDLVEVDISAPTADDDGLLRINEALEKLAQVDPRKAELVKLRYSAGLPFAEAAAALGIAVPTAKQWWAYARAWLTVELGATAPPV